ncbi:SPOR domain-containing protein [Telluria mixta]|uniref:SPOR domain-containing protein n=1 Tax=Telluria mixta TaxID=34071 RepID=A0ABT2C993_9BURK|nr:SPOR domain-containing protein [Telluria mixta]MCS0633963.1 SPOR domain-containing protein [Telluria mixta]WEM93158.1 SPOR domain-containing protein [Telluria mixta]
MGLFSRKSKQDRLTEDSGRFYSKDDDAAIGERARAKRASNAGGGASRRPGADPMLPEKKRARRRLVGAIALALAAAVGLPMLLDSEPKPLAGDIAIQIPAKDKAAPLPVPAADKAVSAADSVDKDEEVVDAPPPAPAAKAPAAVAAAKPESVAVQPPAVTKPEHKPESRPEPAKPEHKEAPKVEHKDTKAEARLAEKERAEREKVAHEKAEHEKAEHDRAERLAREAREKAKAKAEDKPVKPKDDASRAIAILEGKPAEKDKPAEASSSQRFVLQVAALSSQEKAAEVQAKLREAGISSYTQKTSTPNGELIRVRVGPLNKEDAEKVRAKLGRLGMSGAMTPV